LWGNKIQFQGFLSNIYLFKEAQLLSTGGSVGFELLIQR
jgi:hypothetical protein